MIAILGLVIPFIQTFLQEHGQKLPAELLAAGNSFLSALMFHKDDLITQANLEAQRG